MKKRFGLGYLWILLAMTVLSCSGGDNNGSSEGGATSDTDDDETNTNPTYAQTGNLALNSDINGGANVDIVPVGLTNNAVGDVGIGTDNGDGTVRVAIPSVAGRLSLETRGANLTAAPNRSIYTTTVPNQCSGNKAQDGHEFACNNLQYALDENGESSSPNILEEFIQIDDRMQGFIDYISDGAKPYCILVEDSQKINIADYFQKEALTSFFPDIYLSCYDETDPPEDAEYGIDIAFGKKDGIWYLLEHTEGQSMKVAAIEEGENAATEIFKASYQTYNGTLRGARSQFKIQAETGYAEYSEDNNQNQKCGKRAIWGEYTDGNTYMYFQHWRNEGASLGSADDTCADVTADPVEEICMNVEDLATSLALTSAACSHFKSAMSTHKMQAVTDLEELNETTSMRSSQAFDDLYHYRLNDAFAEIKRGIFYTDRDSDEESASRYERWLLDARRPVLDPGGGEAPMTSNTKAPCMRAEPILHELNLPYDLGMTLALNCIEERPSDAKVAINAYGFKGDEVYQWYSPRSQDANDRGSIYLSKITQDVTEVYIFEQQKSTFDEDYYEMTFGHLIANSKTKQIEFVIAGENQSGESFGCGVQFKAGPEYMFAKGRFESVRNDTNWYVASDCSNVPLQTLCVDSETIKRVDMSECRKRGLDFLTLKPVVPKGALKDQKNIQEVDFVKFREFMGTNPKEDLPLLGDRGDWGAYNNMDAQPDINDPQYNIPMVAEGDEDRMINLLANCRITDELIAQGDSRTTEDSLALSYDLDISQLETDQLDALSVASAYEVVRVTFQTNAIGNEVIEPADYEVVGTAQLYVVENGEETAFGDPVDITKDSNNFEIGKLFLEKSALADFEQTALRLKINVNGSTSCSEPPPDDPDSVDEAWGRASVTYEISQPKILY